MCDGNSPRNERGAINDKRNKCFTMKDIVGKRHVFVAGEQEMTEEWIAFLRHDENEVRSSNYHYYFRWNGKEYLPSVMRSDLIDPDELEHYPSMIAAEKDGETILIEREEREAFLARFHEAMSSLTAGQMELIRKRCDLGLSNAEIAKQENVSPGAISRRWDRIKRKLNKILEREGG